jgi:hypothetical protein
VAGKGKNGKKRGMSSLSPSAAFNHELRKSVNALANLNHASTTASQKIFIQYAWKATSQQARDSRVTMAKCQCTVGVNYWRPSPVRSCLADHVYRHVKYWFTV